MRVLILGGDSAIGSALAEYWSHDKHVQCYSSTRHKSRVSNSRPYINLEEPELFQLYMHYDVAILCAAESNIAKCESNKEKTRVINVVNTYTLSKELSQSNTYVVFLSSNQVFDGTSPFSKVNDKTNPTSEYGRQKADAEKLISNLKNFSILRLTKVIHPNLSLLTKWDDNFKRGEQVNAFKNMTLSPVDIKKVILKIDSLARHRKVGVFHCSGDLDMSYYDFAVLYARRRGYSEDLIKEDFCKRVGVVPPLFTSLDPH